jgi:hypothetical protein
MGRILIDDVNPLLLSWTLGTSASGSTTSFLAATVPTAAGLSTASTWTTLATLTLVRSERKRFANHGLVFGLLFWRQVL